VKHPFAHRMPSQTVTNVKPTQTTSAAHNATLVAILKTTMRGAHLWTREIHPVWHSDLPEWPKLSVLLFAVPSHITRLREVQRSRPLWNHVQAVGA
jgi:hypothetical protein